MLLQGKLRLGSVHGHRRTCLRGAAITKAATSGSGVPAARWLQKVNKLRSQLPLVNFGKSRINVTNCMEGLFAISVCMFDIFA